MGDYEKEPIIAETDFEPEADVFNIWVSVKSRPSTKNSQPITVKYWEGCWDIPEVARAVDDKRKRPQITASSTVSEADAADKCRQKVMTFWMTRNDGLRQEIFQKKPSELTREQRRSSYTVQSFLEEWFASRTNPHTMPENRWATNTAGRNKTILNKWIYPYLGNILLTSLTHEQVRIHFAESLPSVVDEEDQRVLGDRRIRGIYSVFKTGMNRAGAKGLIETGEYLEVGIQMSFEPAGVPEDIDSIMWTMNSLLQREDVINDPLALRWALAYGQGLRRGERCGLKWSDIDLRMGKMKIQRQLNYTAGRGDYLDERLKANEARLIDITSITMPILLAARARRDELEKDPGWNPREEYSNLVLLREDGQASGSPEKLNHDNELFHQFMSKYDIQYRNLSPGSLRHACATFFANYGGAEGRGVSREMLRMFMGHSPKSKLDAYYARSSQAAMSREFGATNVGLPNHVNT
jgi:integrase